MDDYLKDLNAQQRDAVIHVHTPQLVIAGAGSGKTRVLTYKIVHLLDLGYNPSRILALTFTNKAAGEMRDRIMQLVGEKTAARLWMGTFHSVFLRILRLNVDCTRFRQGFTIYDNTDSRSLVKTIIQDLGLDEKVYKPATVYNAISTAKNALVSPEEYKANKELLDIDRKSGCPRIYEIYDIYNSRCVVANSMDFDDLLYYTYKLFKDNKCVLDKYREYFQYVLVDEYQDTNYAQHCIITLLTEGKDNLSVVGDDAQSIYSFRGARISNILNLQKNYPNLSTFKLEQNYRSTRTIIEAANSLIEKNIRQIPKQIFSENEKGTKVEVIPCHNEYEEAGFVAALIGRLNLLRHDPFSDFAVLYRTNAQSRVLEEALRRRNIPYKIYGGLSFYQRKEIKDAIAYFRLAVNPDDDEAFRRIINVPARGIGSTTVGKIVRVAFERQISCWQAISECTSSELGVNAATKRKLDSFRVLAEDFIARNRKGEDAYSLASHIIQSTGMIAMLMGDRTPESISKRENLQELLNGARIFVDNKMQQEGSTATDFGMTGYLNEVSLATDMDGTDGETSDYVTLMTVHSSKGLEFRNVIIVGLEEDLFPSAMSKNSSVEIEEERRLLYVAVTRAKKRCFLTFAKERTRNGEHGYTRMSRFINDFDPRYLSADVPLESDEIHEPVRIRPANKNITDFPRSLKPAISKISVSTVRNDKNVQGADSTGYSLHSLAEISVGDRIKHPRFLDGTVIEMQNLEGKERIIVEFDDFGQRVVLLQYSRFQIINK